MMQTNLERFAVFGSSDPAEREVDFAGRREEETRRLGLPWPRPVVRVGHPSMDLKWQQVLHKALDNNDFPSLAALPWWKPGMGIKQSMKEGIAVAAVGHMLVQEVPVIVLDQEQAVLDQDQVATEEPDKKKRKKFFKQWLQDPCRFGCSISCAVSAAVKDVDTAERREKAFQHLMPTDMTLASILNAADVLHESEALFDDRPQAGISKFLALHLVSITVSHHPRSLSQCSAKGLVCATQTIVSTVGTGTALQLWLCRQVPEFKPHSITLQD
eukprot:5120745-Amphidinium_carterae.1